jgi:hypothetical protein
MRFMAIVPASRRRAPRSPLKKAQWTAALGLLSTVVAAPAWAGDSLPVVDAAAPPADEPGLLGISAAARATAARTSPYAVDPNGARSSGDLQGASRITLRGELDSGDRLGSLGVKLRLGGDFATGTFTGEPTLEGDRLPGSRFDAALLTEAWAGVAVKDLVDLRAGVMTSQWGMGLVANDGGQAFDGRRDDWFSLTSTGDRVARAILVVQPFGRFESSLRGLFLAAAADRVIEDANARRADGDVANQGVFAARFYAAKNRWAGLYYVYRDQTYASGRFLRGHVIDGTFDFDLGDHGEGLRLQGEGAVILGTTSLAPTPEHPEHDVRQGAAVARVRYDLRPIRLELDAGWFSGDQKPDDGTLTGFKANPNYQQGILLFSQVLGTQSGRARLTASDRQYVGQPADDLDHLATNGSVTSAVTVFPKVGYRHSDLLEVYGGVLLAFAPEIPIDPFTTAVSGGGQPRNALGNAPTSSMLGTEVDLGVSSTLAPDGLPVSFQVRAEYGVLLPGGALSGLDSPIQGGRLTVALLPSAK